MCHDRGCFSDCKGEIESGAWYLTSKHNPYPLADARRSSWQLRAQARHRICQPFLPSDVHTMTRLHPACIDPRQNGVMIHPRCGRKEMQVDILVPMMFQTSTSSMPPGWAAARTSVRLCQCWQCGARCTSELGHRSEMQWESAS